MRGGVFDGTDNGRPDGDDASPLAAGDVDRVRGSRGNSVRLVEREQRIETGIAGRRDDQPRE